MLARNYLAVFLGTCSRTTHFSCGVRCPFSCSKLILFHGKYYRIRRRIAHPFQKYLNHSKNTMCFHENILPLHQFLRSVCNSSFLMPTLRSSATISLLLSTNLFYNEAILLCNSKGLISKCFVPLLLLFSYPTRFVMITTTGVLIQPVSLTSAHLSHHCPPSIFSDRNFSPFRATFFFY